MSIETSKILYDISIENPTRIERHPLTISDITTKHILGHVRRAFLAESLIVYKSESGSDIYTRGSDYVLVQEEQDVMYSSEKSVAIYSSIKGLKSLGTIYVSADIIASYNSAIPLNEHEERINQHDTHLSQIDAEQLTQNGRLTNCEAKNQEQDGRLEQVEIKLEGKENRFVVASVTAMNALTGMNTGDKCFIIGAGSEYSAIYIYDGSAWVDWNDEVLQPELMALANGTTDAAAIAGKVVLHAKNGAVQITKPDGDVDVLASVKQVDGVNNSAIHKATAGEIAAMTEKSTPVTTDYLLIEDSADGNKKKRVLVGALPFGTAGAGTGDVVGPSSAVSNNIALFNSTTGKIIKDSGKSIGNANGNIPQNNGQNNVNLLAAMAYCLNLGAWITSGDILPTIQVRCSTEKGFFGMYVSSSVNDKPPGITSWGHVFVNHDTNTNIRVEWRCNNSKETWMNIFTVGAWVGWVKTLNADGSVPPKLWAMGTGTTEADLYNQFINHLGTGNWNITLSGGLYTVADNKEIQPAFAVHTNGASTIDISGLFRSLSTNLFSIGNITVTSGSTNQWTFNIRGI